MSLEYHGETVTLKELRCFAYGRTKGYKVVAEYDGIQFAPFEGFWELDKMLEMAGFGKPDYYQSRIIALPDVQAVIEDVNNSYRVKAVYKMDGESIVTLEDVYAERDKKRDKKRAEIGTHDPMANKQRKTNAQGFYTFGSSKANTPPKVVEKPVDRWAHGMKLHEDERVNPYSLEMQDGEFILVIDRVKLEAQEQAEETERAA